MRYSGMRIGDTATCARDQINGRKLFLYSQKTNVPVYVVLPEPVIDAVTTMQPVNDKYFFWTGEGSTETVAGNWRRSLRKIFRLAGI